MEVIITGLLFWVHYFTFMLFPFRHQKEWDILLERQLQELKVLHERKAPRQRSFTVQSTMRRESGGEG